MDSVPSLLHQIVKRKARQQIWTDTEGMSNRLGNILDSESATTTISSRILQYPTYLFKGSGGWGEPFPSAASQQGTACIPQSILPRGEKTAATQQYHSAQRLFSNKKGLTFCIGRHFGFFMKILCSYK